VSVVNARVEHPVPVIVAVVVALAAVAGTTVAAIAEVAAAAATYVSVEAVGTPTLAGGAAATKAYNGGVEYGAEHSTVYGTDCAGADALASPSVE
jgi:hypothetical protein